MTGRQISYRWRVDNAHRQCGSKTYSSTARALEGIARFHSKSLWDDAYSYVETWLEKNALSSVIFALTDEYPVPMVVARGYASLSFLNSAVEQIANLEVPAPICHLGNYNSSEVNAAEKIVSTLRELAPDAEIHFERIAVTPSQIESWRLPSRPTKQSDTRSKGFGDVSVELDAIAPDTLRDLVKSCIEYHLPEQQLRILKVAEESERSMLLNFVFRATKKGVWCMTMLPQALRLASAGVPAFPCSHDKRPTCALGCYNASTDINVLKQLWLDHPGPLIGVPCGPRAALMCWKSIRRPAGWHGGRSIANPSCRHAFTELLARACTSCSGPIPW